MPSAIEEHYGQNRCGSCLTDNSAATLSFLERRYPGLNFWDTGYCGICHSQEDVLDLPLQISLHFRGMIGPQIAYPENARIRLRNRLGPDALPAIAADLAGRSVCSEYRR